MNRRRRFLAKRKRAVAKALADAASAKHLGREDRHAIQTFWNYLMRDGHPQRFCYVTFDQAAVMTAVRDR